MSKLKPYFALLILFILFLTSRSYSQQISFYTENDQYFIQNDPSTFGEDITIVADTLDPLFSEAFIAGSELRIKIPDNLGLYWDPNADVVISGTAFDDEKVNSDISYDPSNKSMYISIIDTLSHNDNIKISGIKYRNFTGSSKGKLSLYYNGDNFIKEDEKNIYIGKVGISSTDSSVFLAGMDLKVIPEINILNDEQYAIIRNGSIIRVIIPPELKLKWDTDAVPTFDPSLNNSDFDYSENSDTFFVYLKDNIGLNDLKISGLKFKNFDVSPNSNLKLSMNGITINAEDDKNIRVGDPTFNSVSDQHFVVNDPSTTISNIHIQENAIAAGIISEDEIWIDLPNNIDVQWDLSSTVSFDGSAKNKVGIGSIENKRVIIDVHENFDSGDDLIIKNLKLENFTQSANFSLSFSLRSGEFTKKDDKIKTVSSPVIYTTDDHYLATGDYSIFCNPIIIKADTGVSGISDSANIFIDIDNSINLQWDSQFKKINVIGSGSNKVSDIVSFDNNNQRVIIDVLNDFASGDSIKIVGLKFTNIISSERGNLQLSVNKGKSVNNEDPNTIYVGNITLSSEKNQVFIEGSGPRYISNITISDDPVNPVIRENDSLMIAIPQNLLLDWNSSISKINILGNDYINDNVSYTQDNDTLIIKVIENFQGGSTSFNGLQFYNFSQSYRDNLELSKVGFLGVNAYDQYHIRIGNPIISLTEDYKYVVNHNRELGAITIEEGDIEACINKENGIIINKPSRLGINFEDNLNNIEISGSAKDKVNQSQINIFSDSIYIPVSEDFTKDDYIQISGINIYTTNSSIGSLNLSADRGKYYKSTSERIYIANPFLYSLDNQYFIKNDPSTEIELLVIKGDSTWSGIDENNNIRLIIPSDLYMEWDDSQLTFTLLQGNASSKIGQDVSIIDSPAENKTLLIEVNYEFSPNDSIIIGGLKFKNFSKTSYSSLELSTNGGVSVCSVDPRKKVIASPKFSTFKSDKYAFGDPPTSLSRVTISGDDDLTGLTNFSGITANKDIRIIIPDSLDLKWNTNKTWNISGSASSKIDDSFTFENNDKTLIIDVLSDFNPNDQILIDDLQLMDFGKASIGYLGVSFNNNQSMNVSDKKFKSIGHLKISSADNQILIKSLDFKVAENISIYDDSSYPVLTPEKDIKVIIPPSLELDWKDVSLNINESRGGLVSKSNYNINNDTIIIDVIADFNPGDYITISDCQFFNFDVSISDSLRLSVNNKRGWVNDYDDKYIKIGNPEIYSEKQQVFVVSEEPAVIEPIIIKEDPSVPVITSNYDLKIIIPDSLDMTWDKSISGEDINISPSGFIDKNNISYEGDSALVLPFLNNVNPPNLNPISTLIISGAKFSNFKSRSSGSLYLDFSVGAEEKFRYRIKDSTEKYIRVPDIYTDFDQYFVVNDTDIVCSDIKILGDEEVSGIRAEYGLKIIIPDGLAMDWVKQVGDIEGRSSIVSSIEFLPEINPDTIFISLTQDLPPKDSLILKGFKFRNFSASSRGKLGLSLDGGKTKSVIDTNTIFIGQPTFYSICDSIFIENNFNTNADTSVDIIIEDDPINPVLGARKNLFIYIPSDLNISWDTTQHPTTIIGPVKDVRYLDKKHFIIDLKKNYEGQEVSIQIQNLGFTDFYVSKRKSLKFSATGAKSVTDYDNKTIRVAKPVIFSANDLEFSVNQTEDVSSKRIVIKENEIESGIIAEHSIRIYLPNYLYLDFSFVFKPSIENIKFENPSRSSHGKMQLGIKGENIVNVIDTAEIFISEPIITSIDDQYLAFNDPDTKAKSIKIIGDTIKSGVKKENGVQFIIPNNLNLNWSSDFSNVEFRGNGKDKGSNIIRIDSNRIVLNLIESLNPRDTLIIDNLFFTDIENSSQGNLGFSIDGKGTINITDSKFIRIGHPTIVSYGDSIFIQDNQDLQENVVDIEISADSEFPILRPERAIQVSIPSNMSLCWDTLKVANIDNNKVDTLLYLNNKTFKLILADQLEKSERITISNLEFVNIFVTKRDYLKLSVSNGKTFCDYDSRSIRVGNPKIYSQYEQNFIVNDPSRAAARIVIKEETAGTIIVDHGIRITIPNNLNMKWGEKYDLSIGGAVNKINENEITYEEDGKTLFIPVTESFIGSDSITINNAEFMSFSGSSYGKLGLSVKGAGIVNKKDTSKIYISQPSIYSIDNQYLASRDPGTFMDSIFVKGDSLKYSGIYKDNGIIITIPDSLDMEWDYQNTLDSLNEKIKVIDSLNKKSVYLGIKEDFKPSESIYVYGLAAKNFYNSSRGRLQFSLNNGNSTNIVDNKTIFIGVNSISSFADQIFIEGGKEPETALPIRISDDDNNPILRKGKEIRVMIPDTLNMTFDTLAIPAISGPASEKIEFVNYETKKSLLLTVIENFDINNNEFTIQNLKFKNLKVSKRNNLNLSVNTKKTINSEDDKTIRIGKPFFYSSFDQLFITNEGIIEIAPITIGEDPREAVIKDTLKIIIPENMNLIWDENDNKAWITAKDSVKNKFENYTGDSISVNFSSNKVMQLFLEKELGPSDSLTISGLNFIVESGSYHDSLKFNIGPKPYGFKPNLEIRDIKDIYISAPKIYSEKRQVFIEGDPPIEGKVITIKDDNEYPIIKKGNEIRVKIPDELKLNWDTDSLPKIDEIASSKIDDSNIRIDANNKLLILPVKKDFEPGDSITVSKHFFRDFYVSQRNFLTLDVTDRGKVDAKDDKSLRVGKPEIKTILSNQNFGKNIPIDTAFVKSIFPLKIYENPVAGGITWENDIRVKIPDDLRDFVNWDTLYQGEIKGSAKQKVESVFINEDTLIIDVIEDFDKEDDVEVYGLNLNIKEAFIHQIDSLPQIFPKPSKFELIVNKEIKRVVDIDTIENNFFIPIMFTQPKAYSVDDISKIAFHYVPNIFENENELNAKDFQIYRDSVLADDSLFVNSSYNKIEIKEDIVTKNGVKLNLKKLVIDLMGNDVRKINKWYINDQENTNLSFYIPAQKISIISNGIPILNPKSNTNKKLISFIGLINPKYVKLTKDDEFFNPNKSVKEIDLGNTISETFTIKVEDSDSNLIREVRENLEANKVYWDGKNQNGNIAEERLYLLNIFTEHPSESNIHSFNIQRQVVIDTTFPTLILRKIYDERFPEDKNQINDFAIIRNENNRIQPISGIIDSGIVDNKYDDKFIIPVSEYDTLRTRILDNFRLDESYSFLERSTQDTTDILLDSLFFKMDDHKLDIRLEFNNSDIVSFVDTSVSLVANLTVFDPINFKFAFSDIPNFDNIFRGVFNIGISVADQAGNTSSGILTYRSPIVDKILDNLFFNYPNPFSSVSGEGTRIRYLLTKRASIGDLKLFNAAGELIQYFDLENASLLCPGEHIIHWNGKDLWDNYVATGVYFAILNIDGDEKSLKIAVYNDK